MICRHDPSDSSRPETPEIYQLNGEQYRGPKVAFIDIRGSLHISRDFAKVQLPRSHFHRGESKNHADQFTAKRRLTSRKKQDKKPMECVAKKSQDSVVVVRRRVAYIRVGVRHCRDNRKRFDAVLVHGRAARAHTTRPLIRHR